MSGCGTSPNFLRINWIASDLKCPTDLSAPVDVYSDWVDACDAVAKDTADQYDGPSTSQPRGSVKQAIPEEIGHDDGYLDD